MWTRKELKSRAKQNIKKNYGKTVLVCFLIAFFASGYDGATNVNTDLSLSVEGDEVVNFRLPSGSEQIKKIILDSDLDLEQKIEERKQGIFSLDKYGLRKSTHGAIAEIINNVTKEGDFILGVLSALNEFFFNNRVVESVVIFVGAIISFLFWFFVRNIVIVGEIRFFLENKTYKDTEVSNLLFVYKTKNILNVANIMFRRFIQNALWFLTIIGGIIKAYSYSMIPYILAENPAIPRKEAFELSKTMMQGNKFDLFKLDLSFILWELLSVATLGIAGYLFVNPFATATKTELYYVLREEAISNKIKNYEFLDDIYLLEKPDDSFTVYPIKKTDFANQGIFESISINYKRDYPLETLILLFFSFAMLGWGWEVFLYLFSKGSFINRGVLIGPWLPIYGTGGVFIIILLKRWADKPLLVFGLTMVLCGFLEYSTSWILEYLFKQRWWDYTDYFLNINGRICLEGLLFFGAGGSLFMYILAPILDELYSGIPKKIKKLACVFLVTIFFADVIISTFKPNIGDGITSETIQIEEGSNIEKIQYDEYKKENMIVA